MTGIDGVYRHTCEMVMSLLRSNRESLLAVLEAFIHDPLLQWVLHENRKDFNHLENKLDDGGGGGGGVAPAIGTNCLTNANTNGTGGGVHGVTTGNNQSVQLKPGARNSDYPHRQVYAHQQVSLWIDLCIVHCISLYTNRYIY